MKTFLTTISLVGLTAFSAQAQTVEPIVLPDSTEAYIVSRPFLEYAIHAIELAPLQAVGIEDLRSELLAANEQIMIRDRTITNLEVDRARLEALVGLGENQLSISQRSVEMLDRARRRASLWNKISGAATVALGIVAILK